MSNQDFQAQTSAGSRAGGHNKQMGDIANEALSQASQMARDVGRKAKQAAADTASTMTDQVKEMLDRQIGTGANIAGHFANSARRAADDLDNEAPMLANVVRNFAGKIEDYAGDLENQTVDQLARTAADFTRRQPAVVFGLAALAGFLLFRTIKSAPAFSPNGSPSLQPDPIDDSEGMQQEFVYEQGGTGYRHG